MIDRSKSGFIILIFCLSATAAQAADAFVLPYRGQNHWVHSDDNKPLISLMQQTAKNKNGTLEVLLPDSADKNLYTERLKVIRNLLMPKTPENIIIRQGKGTSPENTITVIPQSNLQN